MDHKRKFDDRSDDHRQTKHKKQDQPQHRQDHKNDRKEHKSKHAPSSGNNFSFKEGNIELPRAKGELSKVPPYKPVITTPAGLPSLPEIQSETLSAAPFRHRSSVPQYNRGVSVAAPEVVLTYEALEFLGDAYVELIATRLIYARFPQLSVGQQSQLRELLVKNETLSELSRAYGFQDRINADNQILTNAELKSRGNKGFSKILADVFEAYVGAVIESDKENGFAVAEEWLTLLWTPILLKHALSSVPMRAAQALDNSVSSNPATTYDPNAKAELQRRVGSGKAGASLIYEPYRDSIELRGAQLGQSRHFIALYMTGYGYERRLLGKGQGGNKVEAGNWAAMEAMYGECKDIVDECAMQWQQRKAEVKEHAQLSI